MSDQEPSQPRGFRVTYRDALNGTSLSITERAVARGIAEHCDWKHGGRCWPSIVTLAHEVGGSSRTITRTIGSLVDKGWLTLKRLDGIGTYYYPTIPTPDTESPLTYCQWQRGNKHKGFTPDKNDTNPRLFVQEPMTNCPFTPDKLSPNLPVSTNELPTNNQSTGSRFARFRKNWGRSLRSLPQEKSPNEQTSHPSPELTLTRAASECLAALDPQAPMEVDPEARESAADQIDVDREPRAMQTPLRGLSGSDLSLSEQHEPQDHHMSDEPKQTPPQAPPMSEIAEPVPMAIREIARKVAKPLWDEARARGPIDPISISDMARVAGIDLEHEAQSWHDDQPDAIDVDRELSADEPPPLRGLSGSDLSLSEQQAPSADAQAPREHEQMIDHEEWIVPDDAPEWMADLAYIEDDATRREQLAMARGMYMSRTTDADRRERMRREFEAAEVVRKQREADQAALLEQRMAEAQAKRAEWSAAAEADRNASQWTQPNPKYDTSLPDMSDQAQGTESVCRAAANPPAHPAPQTPVEAPNRDAQALEIKTLVHTLEDCVARAGIDSGGRDVMMCLRPIVTKAIERGVSPYDVELEAILRIQDASVADIRDERGRFRWMIQALHSTLASLNPSQRDMSEPTNPARCEVIPHEQRPIPKTHPCYGQEGIVTYGDLERANAEILARDPDYVERTLAEFHARMSATRPKIKSMDLKTGKEIAA